jgi:hypothetical protein
MTQDSNAFEYIDRVHICTHTEVEKHNIVDLLAERYRAASDKIDEGQRLIKAGRVQSQDGRALWIEGTLDLAVIVREKRIDLPDHHAFGRWLQQQGLRYLSNSEMTALHGFGRDLVVARKMLEESTAISWRGVWEKTPKRPRNDTPPMDGKGVIPAHGRPSGSWQRKRRNTIPTVMRDDYEPGSVMRSLQEQPAPGRRRRRNVADNPPVLPRKAVKLNALTREQVDPDFVGTPLEFATKYGHVNLQTKQQIEHHKHQEELMAWLGLVSDHERTARALLAATAADSETLREWMSKPAKAEKLRTWFSNIERACESLRGLSIHK